MTNLEKTSDSETFAHAGVMLAVTEVLKARDLVPGISTERAAAVRRAAQGASSSFDYPNALLLLSRYPELLEAPPILQDVCRSALRLIVLEMRPAWSSLIPQGYEVVRESLLFSARNVLQCFEYGELFQDSESTNAWWDELEAIIRAAENAKKSLNGRVGEQLSMDYERMRLNLAGREDLAPVWMARRNAYAGYDIESYDVSGELVRKLYIEVKACAYPPLSFHLTPNEVKVARSKRDTYMIHLWDISEARLTQITTYEIEQHIPLNIGSGEWRDTEVFWPPKN